MKKYLYYAYNMTISSEIELPELLLAAADSGEPDVHIKLGTIESPEEHHAKPISPFAWLDKDRFSLTVPDIAKYQVVRNDLVIVEPMEGSEPEAVRLFLLGSVFAVLLFRRGLLLLHGSAIRIDQSSLVCVGPSGAGKSTLAAAFIQRGQQMLADDVVAVDAHGRALSAFPRIKLWQDSADILQIRTGDLHRVRQSLAKFNLPSASSFCAEPLPIRWIYLLGSDHRTEVEVEPVRGMDCFQTLLANTYRRRFMVSLNLGPSHLHATSLVARQAHMAKVVRPKSSFDALGLADRILEDAIQAY